MCLLFSNTFRNTVSRPITTRATGCKEHYTKELICHDVNSQSINVTSGPGQKMFHIISDAVTTLDIGCLVGGRDVQALRSRHVITDVLYRPSFLELHCTR